jgi:transcriptional antiterminator RfaH
MNTFTKNWFAVYTRSNYEKKVYALLEKQSIETYLPIQKSLRQWSDRKRWVEEPLIRSYIFVKISEKQYFQVLNTPGVVCFVTFSGKAAVIPPAQIEILRRLLTTDITLEVSTEALRPGDTVEIIAGKLLGITGELIEHKGNKKVVIRIEQTGHSLLLTIPISFLRLTCPMGNVA